VGVYLVLGRALSEERGWSHRVAGVGVASPAL
jgi:hypothetical protein